MDINSGGNNCSVQLGPPIEDIQTESIGFLAISGEVKVQLLPTPWPRDNLPPPTASLMSIASKTGLLAAAGPEGIILASTESLRKVFYDAKSQNGQLQRFEPLLKIPMNFRISQVTFSSDEKYLILSAESGGGLAVYEVSSIKNGSQQSVFELSTSGKALRALVPNPAPEKAELLALITTDGSLMVANLRERSFVAGAQGFVLKDRVSSMSWSTKGKQLVTGLGDGTASQMTPEGEIKALIPKPPDVSADDYISSILWLENHMFLCIYTPSAFDPNQAPPAKLYLITRTADCKNYTFQKISDPVQPFGLNRSPPHHFMLRLREFPPNLQDIIILASTASTDVGLLTRSKVPLTKGKPLEKVTGVFTMTELSDDSRRAQLPFSAQFGDTSPIGVALDLSSRENVLRPIPGDEISETSSPVPGLMLLNNEGVLASWWVIYSESVRQKTVYPGLALEPDSNTTSMNHPSSPFGGGGNPSSTTNQSPFSNHTFTTVLGASRPTPTFGSASQLASGSTFGATSALGTQKSAWGSTPRQNAFPSSSPEFGKTAFGSNQNTQSASSFTAPTFGKPSIPSFGIQSSVWGTPASNTSNTAFGNNSGNEKVSSVFGSATMGTGESKPALSGFASFASKNEFGRLVSQSTTMESVLKSQSSSSPITSQINSIQDKQATSSTSFGLGGTGSFVLGTTFKSEPSIENDLSPIEPDKSNELFGNAFANALGATAIPPITNTTLKEPQDNSVENLEDQNMDQSEPDESDEPDEPDDSALNSNLEEKVNKELSPESSYEIIENNDFTNISKSKNPTSFGLLFGEIQPSLNEKHNDPPKSSHDQKIAPDSSKSLESSQTVENFNIVSQQLSFEKNEKSRESTVAIEPVSPDQDDGDSYNENQSTDQSGADVDRSKEIVKEGKELKEVGILPKTTVDTQEESEKKHEPEFMAHTETEIHRHNKIVAQREAEERRRNEIVAQRKAEEKRHNELVAQREAEEKRRNEIVAQRKAEEKRHKELLARWEAEEKRREELKAQKEAEEKQAIVDSDDNCMQNFLASELEPTTRLNDFIAHSDYVSTLTVESIPAQVEAVYRDINSMVDTLSLNARSLHEFILGHTRKRNSKLRSRNDLNNVSIWTLGEIKTLSSIIENELSEELENGRIKNFNEKIENCKELQKDLIKLRAKHVDIKKIIATSQDPNRLAIARAQPLGVKQATQQHDLRRNFMKFQRLLSEAEEGISVLKAKIVSQTVMNQRSNSSAGPTVEAVMRTITKLTNMAEKKSGDIDVLEGQLRKLKVTSCISDFEIPTTPTKQFRSSYRNSFSKSFSPDHLKTSPNPNLLLSSIASSGLQVSSPSRKTLTCYSAEEKAHLRYSLDKKKKVKSRLRLACQNLGVRVRYVDNDI